MDSRGAPERVRGGQACNEGLDLGGDGRATPDRPGGEPVQYARKRHRCHRRTVWGVTITRGCLHLGQALASPTQKRRSVVRSRGRVAVRLYTASC